MKNILSACLLFSSGAFFYAEGADVLVEVNGSVIENTCSVSQGSAEQTVNMGNWATKNFTRGTTTMPVKFTIDLEDCGDLSKLTSGVTVSFAGMADSFNNELLALNAASTASNIGIAILDKNKTRIPLGIDSIAYPLQNNIKNFSLIFYAQYIATANNVEAGTADADATFTLTYK